MTIEIGRICVKLVGHEAGRKCVVVDAVDKNFVVIAGPSIKRRRCNISHLQPTEKKLNIPKGCSEDEVKRAFESSG